MTDRAVLAALDTSVGFYRAPDVPDPLDPTEFVGAFYMDQADEFLATIPR